MSTSENKALVEKLMAAFNSEDPNQVDPLLIPDYIHHDPNLPPELQRGRENYKKMLGMFSTSFPGFRMTTDHLLADGDKVAVRWTFHGTHRGTLMGIPPTGREITITGTEIYRIADGKVVEGWVNFDALGMMQQLGAIPAPAAT